MIGGLLGPVLDATGGKITGRNGIWNPSGDNIAFIDARISGVQFHGSSLCSRFAE